MAWSRGVGAGLADAEGWRRHAPVGAVCLVAGLAGVALWSAVLGRGGEGHPLEREAVSPLGDPGLGAASLAAGAGTVWAVGLRDRRVRPIAPVAGAPATDAVVGAAGDLAMALATGRGVVWVALQRAGAGAVVGVEPGGGRRVRATGDLLPEALAVLPARVVVVGENRVAALPLRAGRGWAHPSPGAIDVEAGYGSVWVLSRGDGGRSLVTRRDPATGRVVGRRGAPAAATAIAVGLGAVWVANGCPNGVLRAPVGPGPATCVRVGKGPADVAVGAGSAWAADGAGRRVVQLDARNGVIVRAWAMPRPPASLAVGGTGVVALTRGGQALLLRGSAPADPARAAASGS